MIAVITKESKIGEVIMQKGMAAAEIMDVTLCNDGERACCPGTSLNLGFASRMMGKCDVLPELLAKLNALPDCPYFQNFCAMVA